MAKYTKAEIRAEVKRRLDVENQKRLLELQKVSNTELRQMLKSSKYE